MGKSLYTANEVAAFLLEVLVLVVLAIWGFSVGMESRPRFCSASGRRCSSR